MLKQLVSAACKAAEQGHLAFFAGAGISRPSGLPTSSEIIERCVSRLIEATPYQLSCKTALPPDFGKKMRLEYFCQVLGEVNEEARLLPLRLLAGGRPSRFHYFLAACAQQGLAPVTVTTNFDVLIEEALEDVGVPYKVLWSEKDLTKFAAGKGQTILVKIHGTLDPDDFRPLPGILADVRSIGKGLSQSRRRSLQGLAGKSNLLFLGYSGRDYFGAMSALFSSQPLPVYWVNHSGSGADTNHVIKNWVVKSTGGIYVDADTREAVEHLSSQLGITVPSCQRAAHLPEFDFADGLSDLERPFALAHLYSRDRRSDPRITYESFKECTQLISAAEAPDPLVLGRAYLQWARTLERLGRTTNVYADAISILRKAEALVQSNDRLFTEVQVALCDMQYCLAYLSSGGGSEQLPLIEMLIDKCLGFNYADVLSRAYSTKARICRNSIPGGYGTGLALDCYVQAAEALEPLGAQDLLPILYFEQFRLARELGRGPEAARAITACLRGALLLAESPDADWVRGVLQHVSRFVSDRRFKGERAGIAHQLTSLGFGEDIDTILK